MSAPTFPALNSYLQAASQAMQAGDMVRAATLAEQGLAEGHEHALLLTLAAYRRLDSGDAEGALAASSRAVALNARNIDALAAQASALVRLGRRREAVAVFDKALAAAPNDAELHYTAARTLEQVGELKSACAAFERAFELAPANVQAAASLAYLSAARGDMAKARDFGRRALALDERQADAVFALALADMDEGKFEDARRRLVEIAAIANIGRVVCATADGMLGDALDGMGQKHEAFAAYTRSGEAMRALYAPPPGIKVETVLARTRRIAGYVSRMPGETWSARQAGNARARAHVFLVGFARSGTTLLAHVLAAHPKIISLDEERNLAASLPLTQSDEGLARLAAMSEGELDVYRDAYWKSAASVGFDDPDKALIDKMPLNTELLCLIARLFPEAKVLFALRDPRDVVLSCFRRRFDITRQNYELLTLQSTVAYYDATMELREIYRAKLALPWLDVRNEDLIGDFERTTREVCGFIGVEPDAALGNFAARAREQDIHTPGATQIGRGITSGSVGQWRAYAREMAPVMALLAPWVTKFGYEAE
jgi:Flp pilus assembly protein TadD